MVMNVMIVVHIIIIDTYATNKFLNKYFMLTN